MNPPTRQKSSKNILIQTFQSYSKLSLQQLKTQSLEHLFKISPLRLIEKHNPPQIFDRTYISPIDSMRQKYYDPSYIFLTNQIEINNDSECLKRFYHEFQFDGKINMLAEYYKYHTDLPRNFLLELTEIINSYQQDKRQLQYKKVREKIEQEKEVQTKKNDHKDNHQKHLAKHKNFDSKKNILTMNKSKAKKSEKILKNIHLSYVDFEKKPLKSVKRPHPNKHSTSVNQQKSIKNNSLSCKHVLSKDSDQQKNQIKKKTLLKNAGHREMKNLQSKYSEIIGELFRKKRSSSKSSSILNKLENKITNNIDRIGKNTKNLYVNGQNQPLTVQNLKQQNKEERTLQLPEQRKQIQNKKLTRSKSHAAMSVCKSSNLLSTIRNKIPEKALKPLPFRSNIQSGLVSSRKNSSNKQETGETLKRQQFSSNQSMKSSKNNLIHKQSKIVKVFEITKKDLLIYQKGESNSEQEKEFHSSKDYEVSRSKGKENKENEPFDKKRTNSMKSLKTVQLNSISKKSKQIPKKDNLVNNQMNKATMFNRIIKSKIRG